MEILGCDTPFSMWSLNKWFLFSRCLILLWKIGFLATEMALVLSKMRVTLLKITPKSLIVCTIHWIWEQQLHTQPLWWIEQLKFFFEKTSKQEIKKMTCTKNAILVNPTTRKISIRKANKIKRRRSGIPNPKLECVLEIPENPLNGYPM
jgi:hypothetical protein